MKRILVVFALLILGFSLLPQSLSAQTATESGGQMDESSYELPYPGLLPDSPFYFMKAARDRIISILINNPTKKAEFFLLNSDKRISAARVLFEKKNYTVSLETLSKSNNYFEEAITILIDAKKKGYDTGGLFGKMNSAVVEHQEVIEKLRTHESPASVKKTLESEIKRLRAFEEKVTPYMP